MKTAIVYDRINKWGGAERVLLALNELFPEAPLYTSVYDKNKADWAGAFPKIVPSFLQKLPLAAANHEYLAPLMPAAFESHDFSGFDLVISVTSEAAKGVITTPNTRHICYCLTPTRYLWSGYRHYFDNVGRRAVGGPFVKYLRAWDKAAAQRPDVMVAISTEVQARIKKYYGRDSEIIFPPTNSHFTPPVASHRSPVTGYYLIVSRLVKYKKVDLVVGAFNKLGLALVIVGTGKEEKRLKSMAKKNITFVSQLTDEELADYYQKCKAFVMPQLEDFGLAALEAQMSGRPVLAFARGGARDTVINGKTGVFFDRQGEEAIIEAVNACEKASFNSMAIQRHAKKFSKERFSREFLKLISDVLRCH